MSRAERASRSRSGCATTATSSRRSPSQRSESIGRMIDIRRIEPNPHQPRKEFGDLSEMVASVKEKGILEPILVRSHEGSYQIIAGERRYQAAKHGRPAADPVHRGRRRRAGHAGDLADREPAAPGPDRLRRGRRRSSACPTSSATPTRRSPGSSASRAR